MRCIIISSGNTRQRALLSIFIRLRATKNSSIHQKLDNYVKYSESIIIVHCQIWYIQHHSVLHPKTAIVALAIWNGQAGRQKPDPAAALQNLRYKNNKKEIIRTKMYSTKHKKALN